MKAQVIFLILLLSAPAWAQELKPLVMVDSLPAAQKKVIDTSIDSVKSIAFKIDSLKQLSFKKYDSINAALSASTQLSHYTKKIDSIQSRLAFKIDSLTTLPNPDKYLIKDLDSLRTGLDSLKQKLKVPAGVSNAQQELANVQQQVAEKTKKMESAIQEKLAVFNKNGANLPEGIKLPGLPTANLNLPTLNTPGLSLPGTNLNGHLRHGSCPHEPQIS